MTYYFYDLETSGINPRAQRIMQFAGQRTDENFKSVGEPDNWLIRLTEEVLPDPDAILITGITPQKTQEEGYSEAEFLQLFSQKVLQPDTVIVGFNNIRFDDEFMRSTLWRNFYDAYEWQWQDGRSRWDLLDVVRMVRALRPEGIEWPEDEAGNPTNRLELLTQVNGLDHANAHDALSDVQATISVAELLKSKQPQMYEYLFNVRDKKQVKELVNLEDRRPFVYTSGRYEAQYHKTTVAFPLAEGRNKNVIVYDLRYDPSAFVILTEDEIAKNIFANYEERRKEGFVRIPVKELQYNRSPAVAPLGVLTHHKGWERIQIDEALVEKHRNALLVYPEFAERVKKVFARTRDFTPVKDPDFELYDGFVDQADKQKMRVVRAATTEHVASISLEFHDRRLNAMLPRYKARNFMRSITADEREHWESYRHQRLLSGLPGQLSIEQFARRLSELSQAKASDDHAQYLLQELQLYAESVVPLNE